MPLFKFAIIFLCFFLCSCQKKIKSDQVCSPKKCFNVEVADTDSLRQKGLQNRDSLGADQGMLFIFSQNRNHSFWMKDTLIALDMIWIDQNRRVVHLEENVPPCKSDPCSSYTSLKPSLYVLELNAGLAKSTGIKIGDELEFKLDQYLQK